MDQLQTETGPDLQALILIICFSSYTFICVTIFILYISFSSNQLSLAFQRWSETPSQ